MGDIIDGVLAVTTWPQVVVVLGILGYLAYKAHQDSKKVKTMASTVDEVQSQTALVAHEVQNNSGKSLKDVAERTETKSDEVLTALADLNTKLDEHLEFASEESAILAELKAKYLD